MATLLLSNYTLRREGLYSSQLSSWRRQRDEIAKVGMTLLRRESEAGRRRQRIHGSRSSSARNARLQQSPGYSKRSRDDVGDPKKNLRTAGDPPESTRERRERLIVAAEELAGNCQ